ncbi:Translation factor GUF1 [Trypanosoma brucei equiperdum]|uniref:Translation factor GUF1 homolog, mitochondrial n=1 Tax=Trypanosoma brucei equiperdum TaxID=630700 RepID=A0A3L6L0Y6_9TRYP|nr:Translation factor GUF1 [Trypanosoma brucei equiperdum]
MRLWNRFSRFGNLLCGCAACSCSFTPWRCSSSPLLSSFSAYNMSSGNRVTSPVGGSSGATEVCPSHTPSSSSTLLRYTIAPSEPTMGSPWQTSEESASRRLAALTSYPPSNIRNVAVVAHVDHGKTTLSDVLLRRTGVLKGSVNAGAYTDRLLVERERGITVKSQTCSMFLKYGGSEFLLNLIDTPGHVDFQYEVSRSVRAAQAVLLLVDVAQGIEAQTMSHFHMALDQGLAIIPVFTKMDCVLNDTTVDAALQQLEDSTGLLRSEVVFTSAKEQLGVEALLQAIIERVPSPSGAIGLSDVCQLPPLLPGSTARVAMEAEMVPLRAILLDSWTRECGGGLYRPPSKTSSALSGNVKIDEDKDTVTCLVSVIDGTLTARTNILLYHSQKRYEAREVGVIHPELRPTGALTVGMVGYVVFTRVQREDFSVGETLYTLPTRKFTRGGIAPVPGFRRVHPVVFAGFYPDEGEYVTQLREAVEKLRMNDPAVTVEPLECQALGSGLQLGFLGVLHMQIFQERLLTEFGQRVLVTPPVVQYKYREAAGGDDQPPKPLSVHTWRWLHEGVSCYMEPHVTATVVTPSEYAQIIDGEAQRHYRGKQLDMRVMDDARVLLRYKMPLADMVRGFFTFVKSQSHGYASLEYDELVYEEADLVRVDIVVQKARISALAVICPRHEAPSVGKRIVASLKSNLTRTAVDIPLQALVGNKVVARETVRAYRKDVTAKIHAGDISRKQKKWNDQKRGKERMARRTVGGVTLDQSVLAAAMGATAL